MNLRRLFLVVLFAALLAGIAVSASACSKAANAASDDTSTTDAGLTPSGDIDGTVGETINVGNAVISCRTLDATFNPVAPAQRMVEQTPTAPNRDESFYQAYVKVENTGTTPLRVDPEDFACAVGNSVVGVEQTWSGPIARSLLKNSSLEVLVTFRAKAGYQPVLLYSPSWYDGTIRIRAAGTSTTTSTTGG